MHHAHTIHIAFESARPLTVLRSSRKSPFAIYRDLFTQTFGASSPPLAIWPVRVSKRNIRQSLVAFATEIFVYIGHKLRVRVLQSEFATNQWNTERTEFLLSIGRFRDLSLWIESSISDLLVWSDRAKEYYTFIKKTASFTDE